MTDEDPVVEKLKEILRDPARSGIRCLLCGAKPFTIGVWFPSRPCAKLLGEPPGKSRSAVYGLCAVCALRPKIIQQVERVILASASGYSPD